MGDLHDNFSGARDGRSVAVTATPVVQLLNLDGKYNPHGGDMQGLASIGRAIALKLGGAFEVADRKTARQADIYLVPDEDKAEEFFKGSDAFYVTGLNEELTERFTRGKGLVAHRMTPEVLQREAVLFDQHYPDPPRPLIAVMLTSMALQPTMSTTYSFCSPMNEILRHYRQATLFVAGSPRTDREGQKVTMSEMRKYLKAPHVKIVEYQYASPSVSEVFNPYAGLLTRADHMIVYGSSRSMCSERLAAGKTVYCQDNINSDMRWHGWAKYLLEHDTNLPLQTESFAPLNIAPEIADKIIETYEGYKLRHTVKRLAQPLFIP